MDKYADNFLCNRRRVAITIAIKPEFALAESTSAVYTV